MRSFLFILAVLFQFNAYSQCNPYYHFKSGATIEMETFSGNNKKTGKVVNHVKSLTNSGNSYDALIETKTYDAKGKEQSAGEYRIMCDNGIISLDLKSLMPQESLKAYENMDVSFSGEDLEIPPSLKVGDKLKDGKLSGVVKDKSSEAVFATFDLIISDRTVEGKETITTPAGTFDCYKINFNMALNSKMMGINVPVSFKGVEYIAENAGVVKSEHYNKNGKLTGYSLLSKIE